MSVWRLGDFFLATHLTMPTAQKRNIMTLFRGTYRQTDTAVGTLFKFTKMERWLLRSQIALMKRRRQYYFAGGLKCVGIWLRCSIMRQERTLRD